MDHTNAQKTVVIGEHRGYTDSGVRCGQLVETGKVGDDGQAVLKVETTAPTPDPRDLKTFRVERM